MKLLSFILESRPISRELINSVCAALLDGVVSSRFKLAKGSHAPEVRFQKPGVFLVE